MVDGDWIDNYMVELAEWGARIREREFLLEEPEDNHPMAWHGIIDPKDGSEVDAAVAIKTMATDQETLGWISRPHQGNRRAAIPELRRLSEVAGSSCQRRLEVRHAHGPGGVHMEPVG